MNAGRAIRGAAAALSVAAALAPNAGAAAPAPKVAQLVVFDNGSARQANVKAAQVSVKVGGKRCAVGAGTALAALARSRAGALGIRDFGACSSRPADAAQLYVRSIGRDRARGVNGWVYKVGTKLASAGAGDPSGPFGHGRLKSGTRVTWFYCHMNTTTHGCQPTLSISPHALGGGRLQVAVTAYDDHGKGAAAAGVTVHAGTATAQTGTDGTATLSLPAGHVQVFAEKAGEVRSVGEAVDVS